MSKVKIVGRYGYHANAEDMYQLLGVKKLPAEGMPARAIQGVQVYVKPLAGGPRLPRHGKRSSHRVMAICNCTKHVPVGRLHQHKCPPRTESVEPWEGSGTTAPS